MTKKAVFIIFLVLVVVLAGVIFFYFGEKKGGLSSLDLEEIPDTPINEICLKISQPEDLYYCLAVANQEAGFCQNLDMPGQRKLCQGMASRDISYCREIQEPGAKKMCYYELGFLTGEFDYCDEMEDPNECYFAFIHRLHWESRNNEIKPEYCQKINKDAPGGQIYKNCCNAFREEDSSLCQGDKYCLSYFKQTLSFCDNEFRTPGGKFKYKDDCLVDRAMSGKDSSLCAEIEEEELRDLCYGNFSTHISPDISICDKIADEIKRNMCYAEVAINIAQ